MTRLSHDATFLFKFVWPGAWLGTIGLFLAGALFGAPPRWGPGISPFAGRAILAVLFGLGVLILVRLSIPLKRVEAKGAYLHVSNYFSTRVVPAVEIRAVRIRGDFDGDSMPLVEVRFEHRWKIVFFAASEEGLATFLSMLAPNVEVRR